MKGYIVPNNEASNGRAILITHSTGVTLVYCIGIHFHSCFCSWNDKNLSLPLEIMYFGEIEVPEWLPPKPDAEPGTYFLAIAVNDIQGLRPIMHALMKSP